MASYRLGDRLLEKLGKENYYPTDKGFVANCPVCDEEETDKGLRKLLITPQGRIVCYRFRGDSETHWTHVKEICEHLGINISDNSYNTKVGNHSIRMDRDPSPDGRHVIEVLNGDRVRLALDRIDPVDHRERQRFITSVIRAPKDDQLKYDRALQELASRVLRREYPREIVEAGSVTLSDGRKAELTMSGFAVYDPVLHETEIKRSIPDGGVTYIPWSSGFSRGDRGGVLLPDDIVEYHDNNGLVKSIDTYLRKHKGLSNVAAEIIKTYTHVSDLRLTFVAALLCYRPLFLGGNYTAETLYKVVEKFRPTLVLYEGSLYFTTHQLASVPHCDSGGVEFYTPHCSKVFITGDSPPITDELIDDAAKIRGQLTLWKMRNS